MKILFCNEGFIIDGVASFNLYLSTAFRQAGHRVAILGRWLGRGYQARHRQTDVQVLQRISASAGSDALVRQALAFGPDVIITDARRAFALAQRIHAHFPVKILTVFHDPPQADAIGVRSIASLTAGSDAWLSPELPIVEELKALKPGLPIHWIQRPLTGMIRPTPLPDSQDLRVLCLSRLSRWKIPGIRQIVADALRIRRAVPRVDITVVGGGWRRLNLWQAAQKANLIAGARFIHVVGAKIDPQPWIHRSHLVCAGATSAIEAILAERPVIAFCGFWMGPVTEENLQQGVDTHFGERRGHFYVKEKPSIVVDSLIDMLQGWDNAAIGREAARLRARLAPDFDAGTIVRQIESLIGSL